jgi:hypothetical protein
MDIVSKAVSKPHIAWRCRCIQEHEQQQQLALRRCRVLPGVTARSVTDATATTVTASFSVTNTKDTPLRLYPYSALPLRVLPALVRIVICPVTHSLRQQLVLVAVACTEQPVAVVGII